MPVLSPNREPDDLEEEIMNTIRKIQKEISSIKEDLNTLKRIRQQKG